MDVSNGYGSANHHLFRPEIWWNWQTEASNFKDDQHQQRRQQQCGRVRYERHDTAQHKLLNRNGIQA